MVVAAKKGTHRTDVRVVVVHPTSVGVFEMLVCRKEDGDFMRVMK